MIVTEESLRATAHIIGPQSAAAQALAEADCLRKEGYEPQFFTRGQTIFVGHVYQAKQGEV